MQLISPEFIICRLGNHPFSNFIHAIGKNVEWDIRWACVSSLEKDFPLGGRKSLFWNTNVCDFCLHNSILILHWMPNYISGRVLGTEQAQMFKSKSLLSQSSPRSWRDAQRQIMMPSEVRSAGSVWGMGPEGHFWFDHLAIWVPSSF